MERYGPMSNNSLMYQRVNLPWQIQDSETIILHPKKKQAHELNEVGGYIWSQLESPKSENDLLSAICSFYEVTPSIAQSDLEEILNQLKDAELILCQ